MSEDIIRAQAVLREFGYDVSHHRRMASDALIGLEMLPEAAEILAASQTLLDILRRVSGKDFLLSTEDAA